MKEKQLIRKEILAKRKSLDEAEVNRLSMLIVNNIINTDLYKKAGSLCIYMPIRNEVDVTLIKEKAWEDGKKLYLPVVNDDEMEFMLYRENDELKPGAYDIFEPTSGIILDPAADKNILIIMPGSVFSINRDRIGYGGGYYDKYLEKYAMCKTLAAAYGFQVLSEIPSESHDKKPDMIVTEQNIYI